MARSPVQLDYARQGPWHRRPRARLAILLVVVLLGGLACIQWLAAGWRHAQLLYWQRQCLRQDGDQSQAIDPYTGNSNRAWQRYYELLSPPGRRHDPMLFLHEMRNKDGSARLVGVELSKFREGPNSQDGGSICLDYDVIRPATLWSRPKVLGYNSCTMHVLNHNPKLGGSVKLYPGQRDPDDPTHFTFRFEAREATGDPVRSGIFDAWLRTDDSLIFEPRPVVSVAGRP